MKLIKLTNEQLTNLMLYLNRVDMKGTTEAFAMVQIVTAISNAEDKDNG